MNCDSEWNEKLASNSETHRGNGVMQYPGSRFPRIAVIYARGPHTLTGWPGVSGISFNLGHIYKKRDSSASEQSVTENQQNKCSYDSSFVKLLLKFTVLQFEGLVI